MQPGIASKRILPAAIVALALCMPAHAQQSPRRSTPQRILLDTDIGDDIDDAFALALALASPQVKLIGVTTAWGDTGLRARLARRFLCRTGHADVPVFAGVPTHSQAPFSQRAWAEQFPLPHRQSPDAGIDFILHTVRSHPGQITLVAIAPLSNIGALLDKDPVTFRKLKRVVLMGGSIRRGYDYLGQPVGKPSAEYNVHMDVASANKLLASGVPIFMLPLDSTQLDLDAARRARLFDKHTPMTDALMQLYSQWSASTHRTTPVLFDAMAVAYDLNPSLCPMTPMRLHVDAAGYTRVIDGKPNANVCLKSSPERFFSFYMPRILNANLPAKSAGVSCTANPDGR